MLQRATGLRYADIAKEQAGARKPLVAGITAAVIVLSALWSLLFAKAASSNLYSLGWACAIVADALLVPVTVQALRDNALHIRLPWALYSLLVVPIVLFALGIVFNNALYSTALYVPPALCLGIFPLAVWHIVLRASAEEGKTPFFYNRAFLYVQGGLYLFALATALGVLFNLSSVPLVGFADLIPASIASGCVLAGAFALVALLTKQPILIETPQQPSQDAVPPEDMLLEATRAHLKVRQAQSGEPGESSEGGPAEDAQAAAEPEQTGAEDINARAWKIIAEEYELTSRQEMIVKLIADGMSRGDIADQLVLSRNTVNTHARTAYNKLDVHSRDELLDLIRLVAAR